MQQFVPSDRFLHITEAVHSIKNNHLACCAMHFVSAFIHRARGCGRAHYVYKVKATTQEETIRDTNFVTRLHQNIVLLGGQLQSPFPRACCSEHLASCPVCSTFAGASIAHGCSPAAENTQGSSTAQAGTEDQAPKGNLVGYTSFLILWSGLELRRLPACRLRVESRPVWLAPSCCLYGNHRNLLERFDSSYA